MKQNSKSKERRKRKDKKADHDLGTAKIPGLGDKLLVMNPDILRSSSSCDKLSDEDFVTHHKNKRM